MSSTNMVLFFAVFAVAIIFVVILLVVLLGRRKKKKPANKLASAGQKTPAAAKSDRPAEAAPPVSVPLTETQPRPVAPPQPTPSSAPQQDKIRILVVDDNVDTTENVSRLLYFEDDMEVIGQAYNGRQGINMAIASKPHIVLMDINMPDMDGISATKEMSVQAPFSQVVIMSVQSDQQYMRQAMAAGARDFQPKPFTANELVNCIRRVYQIGEPIYRQFQAAEVIQQQAVAVAAQQPKPGSATPTKTVNRTQTAPIILVYSPKGGVGTSTIAANFAVGLQKKEQNIVLVDGDLEFGDLMVHLNIRADRTVSNLATSDEIDPDIITQVLLPHATGLRLLAAPLSPEQAELLTPALFATILKQIKNSCRAIVVDSSSMLSDHTLAMLDIADYILLITTPELTAIKSAKLFLELLSAMEYPVERIEAIINRANIPGAIPADQIRKVLKLPAVYQIPNDIKIYLATNHGKSVFEIEEETVSSLAINQIIKSVWQKIQAG